MNYNDFDDFYNVICAENDIEYPDFLKKCINYEISIENRYLSYTEYELEEARYNAENKRYYKHELYEHQELCEKEYLDALDKDFYDRKKSILNNYFKLINCLKNSSNQDVTNHIFSYIPNLN